MQNISKLSQDCYEIRITYADALTGKRKTVKRRVSGTLKLARATRDKLIEQITRGELETSAAVKAKAKTLEQWKDTYLAFKEPRLASSGYTSEAHNLTLAIAGLESWNPAAIELHHLDEVVAGWNDRLNEYGKPYSITTIKHMFGALKRLLRYVFKRVGNDSGMLGNLETPARRLNETRTTRTGRAMYGVEAARFLAHIKAKYPQSYAIVFTLLATGQRWGSVSALRWQDVQGDWIVFEQSHVRGVVKTGNKTGKLIRLPLTKEIKTVLDWHKARMVEVDHPNLSSDLVFPTETAASETSTNGYQVSCNLRYIFRGTCKALNLEPLTVHDLRRTFNSLQIEAGLDGSILRSITAHSSTTMTDHYYHGSRTAKESAINTVTSLIQCGEVC